MTAWEWKKKCWGKTRCVTVEELYQKHELEVEKGGYCSIHYHRERANEFKVRHGKIEVVQLFGWKTESTTLSAGQSMIVPALVPHMFGVLESGNVIEEYWPQMLARDKPISLDDIVRLTVGDNIHSSGMVDGFTFDDVVKSKIWANVNGHLWIMR